MDLVDWRLRRWIIKEIYMGNKKTMTIKEIANVFGVTAEAVRLHVKKMFPGLLAAGKETRLNMLQAEGIRLSMEKALPYARNLSLTNKESYNTRVVALETEHTFAVRIADRLWHAIYGLEL